MPENINNPSWYNQPGKRECIVEMEMLFGAEAVYWFSRLNDYKYNYRAGEKPGNPAEKDLAKAKYYKEKSEEMANKTEQTMLDKLHHFDSFQMAAFLSMVIKCCSNGRRCEKCPLGTPGHGGCDMPYIKELLESKRGEELQNESGKIESLKAAFRNGTLICGYCGRIIRDGVWTYNMETDKCYHDICAVAANKEGQSE